ncbi:uncharacterized protein C10orf67, mitochondrial-like isoform X2 [Heptranchias perlo]|uniref:uncharacterized protein C10orf67, mitochondrial-like isoform X2 n=1 Tax=Heptranchias perlo TaxID=212740 RepID=UPI003559D794
MAAASSPVQSVFSTDQELVVLLSYSSGESCFPGAAPSDRLKVGFFKTDRATQTDVSDILKLKELSTAVESLVKDIAILKRGVESNTQSLKADYGMKLQEQSLVLYKRMNDHTSYLKDMYLRKIEVLRNSFRQQLADAIAMINAECKINFELDEDDEKEQLVEENEELKEQINFLQQNTEKMSGTIILKEAQIKELGKELKTLKEKNANTESKMRKMFATEEILIKQLEVEKFKGQKMIGCRTSSLTMQRQWRGRERW